MSSAAINQTPEGPNRKGRGEGQILSLMTWDIHLTLLSDNRDPISLTFGLQDLHLHLPVPTPTPAWFLALQTWTELYQQFSWFSNCYVAYNGVSQLHNFTSANSHNKSPYLFYIYVSYNSLF